MDLLKTKNFQGCKSETFPYQIIYEVVENAVIIYSVFNSYQNPSKKLYKNICSLIRHI